MNENIDKVQSDLKKLEALRNQIISLTNTFEYIPKSYNEEEIKKQISDLEDQILKLQKIIEKAQKVESLEIEEYDSKEMFEDLDKVIEETQKLILKRENFEKYKKLNLELERIAIEISC